MSKYLFITSVSACTICPPFFALDDPTVGNAPDGLDPLRHTKGQDFNIEELTNEDIEFLGLASPFLAPKNNYTRIISSFMMMHPESILYIVDGYPKPLIEAHCRGFIGLINQMRETTKDDQAYIDVHKYHEITQGETEDVSTWSTVAAKMTGRHEPHIFFEKVDSYKVMKLRMDNVKAWGEGKGYSVKNFHEHLLSETFPFAAQYIQAVQTYNQFLQGRARNMQRPPLVLAPDTPPVGQG